MQVDFIFPRGKHIKHEETPNSTFTGGQARLSGADYYCSSTIYFSTGITFLSLASKRTSATITTGNDIGSASGQSQPSKKRQRQTRMVGFVSKPMAPLQQSKIDKTLVTMIASDCQPFFIVNDKGYREYTKALNPSYILPSRPTISQQMKPQLFSKGKTDLLEKIKTASFVCLTTDCWTSNTTTGYMSVTCHYIND